MGKADMGDLFERQLLKEKAQSVGVLLDDEAVDRFEIYAKLLMEWNQKMNLTAIKEPEQIVVKHFADSLSLCPYLPSDSFSLIDVGTGAGFPGIPLAIVRGDIRLTLLDSLNKRLLFLKELCDVLKIPAAILHARAEEAGRKPELRGKFDRATARAVAPLPVLCEYCLPFLKVKGIFIAMKGPDGEEEERLSQNVLRLLGGKTNRIEKIELMDGQEKLERRLIFIQKTAETSEKYPRSSAKIAKQPL